MRYYWLRDRSNQDQFDIYWAPGLEINADEFTKHHPGVHHRTTRHRYVQDAIAHITTSLNHMHSYLPLPYAAPPSSLRGCVV